MALDYFALQTDIHRNALREQGVSLSSLVIARFMTACGLLFSIIAFAVSFVVSYGLLTLCLSL